MYVDARFKCEGQNYKRDSAWMERILSLTPAVHEYDRSGCVWISAIDVQLCADCTAVRVGV